MKSWLPSATRKETNSHLSNVETSARDSYSFSFFRFIQSVFPNLPPPPYSPLTPFPSFLFSFPLLSTCAIVRIYYPRATFSLLRIECREPAASHPTPSFWPTSANPRNAWDGKDRGWGREVVGSGLGSTDSRRRGRDGGSDRRGRTPRKLHTRLRSTEE